MVVRRFVTFWLAALAVFILLVWLLSEVLLPFVAGLMLAYLLSPLVDRLERWGVSRLVGTLVITAIFIVAVMLLAMMILPLLGSQLIALLENIPGYLSRLQAYLTDPARPWSEQLFGPDGQSQPWSTGDVLRQAAGWVATFMRSVWSGGRALLSLFAILVVTPVVAFYLLYDWNRMMRSLDDWVPLPHRDTIHRLAREIDRAVAGFVRGQATVCLILGVFYALALWLAGLNFALLIGLVSGLISFVPYLGSLIGLTLSVGVATAQFWPEWQWIALIAAIFFAGQFVEGNILQPNLVGQSVGLHPVWLMFALFAFGYLFGFLGMLLAVPIAAALGVLARYGLSLYLESAFYRGPASTDAVSADNDRPLREHWP